MKWTNRPWRLGRRRLESEVFTLSGVKFRLTRKRGRPWKRGKIIGMEAWTGPSEPDGAWGYTAWLSEEARGS